MTGQVLVLGANGFIGSKLVEALLQQGYCVVGYERFESTIRHKNYRHICGDFCNEQNFATLLQEQEITAIYHLISTTTPKDGTEHVEQEILQNLLPTVRLLEAAANSGVKRFVFASSGGTVYGEGTEGMAHKEDEPLNPACSYGAQKAAIEKYLCMYRQMRGLKTLTVRISNPYGVCLQQGRTQGIIPILLQRLQRGEEITLFGDTIRDYIYIDDVIEALVKLLTYEGNEPEFNIGSGTETRLHHLVELLEDVAGKKFSVIHEQEIRKCDVQHSVLDASLAAQELDWVASVNLSDGVRKTMLDMKVIQK